MAKKLLKKTMAKEKLKPKASLKLGTASREEIGKRPKALNLPPQKPPLKTAAQMQKARDPGIYRQGGKGKKTDGSMERRSPQAVLPTDAYALNDEILVTVRGKKKKIRVTGTESYR